MPTWTDLYVRDSLSDRGTVPSPGLPYYSPDLIVHAQVADPVTVFRGNYDSDPNQTIEFGEYNYVYGRARNLGTSTTGGQMRVYTTKTSLVMFPQQWRQNGLTTAGGHDSVSLAAVAHDDITVTPEPFVWTPPTNDGYGYCMIGQLITADHPNVIPDSMDSWDDFVHWVRMSPNVCWRNLHIVNNRTDPDYDQLQVFSNPTPNEVPITFRAVCTGLPAATVIRLVCDPLDINVSQTLTKSPQSVYASQTCPADFHGSLQAMAVLPPGHIWPTGASIVVHCYIGVEGGDSLAVFADDWSKHDIAPEALTALPRAGRLVEVGNVATHFFAS